MIGPEEGITHTGELPGEIAPAGAPRAAGDAPPFAEVRRELRFGFEIGPGHERFVLPLGLQCELWPAPRFTPLPGTAPWLRGLVNLRGTLAPVYEVAGSLGLEGPAKARERVLILGEGEDRVGLIVQDEPRPVTVALHSPGTTVMPRGPLAGIVRERWLTDSGEPYWELDLEAWIRHAREHAARSAYPHFAAPNAEIEREPT